MKILNIDTKLVDVVEIAHVSETKEFYHNIFAFVLTKEELFENMDIVDRVRPAIDALFAKEQLFGDKCELLNKIRAGERVSIEFLQEIIDRANGETFQSVANEYERIHPEEEVFLFMRIPWRGAIEETFGCQNWAVIRERMSIGMLKRVVA